MRKLADFFQKRGHSVWFDQVDIKTFTDWRQEITRAILDHDIVLIFLTQKSIRPGGVCLDEINIAVGVRGGAVQPVLLETTQNIPSYLTTQQMFMELEPWREHWPTLNHCDEPWFERAFTRLAESLEAMDLRQTNEDVAFLKRRLDPISSDSLIRELLPRERLVRNVRTGELEKVVLQNFIGRESLFRSFEATREQLVWLRLGPGFGKSRFSAELMNRYRHLFTAVHFIDYKQPRSKQPQMFVMSLAYQIARRMPNYRTLLVKTLNEMDEKQVLSTQNEADLFQKLITEPINAVVGGESPDLWILVDALDEANENGRNPIARLIAQNLDRLPEWLHFFVTSRDDQAVNSELTQFAPTSFSDTENKSDLIGYIRQELAACQMSASEEQIAALFDKSEGSILYLTWTFMDIRSTADTFDFANLPDGLAAYINRQFDRLFGNDLNRYRDKIRPLLQFILTAKEPASRGVLKCCLGIKRNSGLDDILRPLGTFFVQSGTADSDTVTPFHKSVADFCRDQDLSNDYYIYPDEAAEDFADRGFEMYESGVLGWTSPQDTAPTAAQAYFLSWLPTHLLGVRDEQAVRALTDFPFLMKRLKFASVERVRLDYGRLPAGLRRENEALDVFANTITSKSNYLNRGDETWPASPTAFAPGAATISISSSSITATGWVSRSPRRRRFSAG